jgi:HEAT repeats
MRPKVVILVLVAAFGVLGGVALFKGLSNKSTTGGEPSGPVAQTPVAPAQSNPTNQASANVVAGQPVVVPEELRQAIIEKATDEIYDLQRQLDDSNGPVIIAALLQKLADPEPEVRKVALRVLKDMNDTNAIPGLQKAVDATPDPREKVAILDAIDYIKMPSITDNVPPEMATNYQSPGEIDTNVQFNPNFMRGRQRLHNSQPAPANQPQ